MLRKMKNYAELAVAALRRNRMRTFLTCLGIAIGVASIILILSLTGSVRSVLQKQMSATNEDVMVIREKKVVKEGNFIERMVNSEQKQKAGLEIDEMAKIMQIEGVKRAVPIVLTNGKMVGDKEVEGGMILGSTIDLIQDQNLELKSGAFFGSGSEKNVIVLGRNLALELFGTAQAVGKVVTMLGEQVIVVGVLEEVTNPINMNAIDYNSAALVSVEYLRKIGKDLKVNQINIEGNARSRELIGKVLGEMKNGSRFEVASEEEVAGTVSPTFKIMANMLMVVAGVALVIGGVGVMNIMLVAASERTREIGVRKAVGATGMNILMQFLLESMILSLVGGVLGIILGVSIVVGFALVLHVVPFLSWGILGMTLVVALVVGVVFGLYPAIVAARKSPIGALKYYR